MGPQARTTVTARAPARAMRVLLVDDHPLILDAMASMLGRQADVEVVGLAHTIRELAILEVARPDVVVMDYWLPDGNGTEGCRLVRARWPDARIVVLTGVDDAATAAAVVEAGADGYLVKTEKLTTVMTAIRDAFERKMTLSPRILGDIAARLGPGRPHRILLQPLTPRELMVLKALSHGHSTATIATDLGLVPGTVRVHVEAIRRKLNATSRLGAVTAAIRYGIVEGPRA